MVSPCAIRAVTCASADSLLMGCGAATQLPEGRGMGPKPILPSPEKSPRPTINVVESVGARPDLVAIDRRGGPLEPWAAQEAGADLPETFPSGV